MDQWRWVSLCCDMRSVQIQLQTLSIRISTCQFFPLRTVSLATVKCPIHLSVTLKGNCQIGSHYQFEEQHHSLISHRMFCLGAPFLVTNVTYVHIFTLTLALALALALALSLSISISRSRSHSHSRSRALVLALVHSRSPSRSRSLALALALALSFSLSFTL
jgi:hypothetical protein